MKLYLKMVKKMAMKSLNGKKNWHIYEGEWKDNIRNGQGILKWNDGDIFEGEFKDYKADGHGIFK